MALSAFLAIASGVNVIDAVAGYAFRRDVFIALIGMTAVATRILVLAVQRELGLVMVKAAGLPCLHAVALAAFLAQALLVWVILVMAVVACRRRVTVFGVLLVAAGAGQPHMRAFQGEIGLMVVKGIRVEMHDIAVASYMFGMACLARHFLNIIDAAVKSSLILDIRGNFLMAIEAEIFLRVFAERFVALLAFGFIFGMIADHLARHDQGFQAGCGRG